MSGADNDARDRAMNTEKADHKFKVGDKVIRKPEYQKRGNWVYADTEFKVASAKSGRLRLDGTGAMRWLRCCFDLVTPNQPERYIPKPGDYAYQRDGKIVGPLKQDKHTGFFYVTTIFEYGGHWYSTGNWLLSAESSSDLIRRADKCEHCGSVK